MRLLPHLLFVALLWLGLALGAHAADDMQTFEVIAHDGRLLPENLEVPAGIKLKLALKNQGRTPVEFENLDLRVEKVLAPGAASFVVIHPLRPGTYRFVDEFHPATGEMLIIAK
jgi:hypothetical protein